MSLLKVTLIVLSMLVLHPAWSAQVRPTPFPTPFPTPTPSPPPTPTPMPRDTVNNSDAAQQAQNARNAQLAALPHVKMAIAFYTPKCMGGEKSNCGPFGGDSCTCAYLAWKQYYELMASMQGAQKNSENHSSNPGGGSTGGRTGSNTDYVRARNMMIEAGFKLNPDGTVAAMPNGSAPPNVASGGGGSGSGSGGFNPGEFKPPNFDQGKAATAGAGPEMKDKGGKNGSADGMALGGGGGGGLSRGGSDEPSGATGKANVSGLSKKFGKDTIGVAGDNIFEMVTRRYKANQNALKK